MRARARVSKRTTEIERYERIHERASNVIFGGVNRMHERQIDKRILNNKAA